MKNNRHVPLIMGIAAFAISIWLFFSFHGWWPSILGTFLLFYGWISIKTALFASDKEISELTGRGPISEETKKKLEDRM